MDAESKEQVMHYIQTGCRDTIVLVISHESFQLDDGGAVVPIAIGR